MITIHFASRPIKIVCDQNQYELDGSKHQIKTKSGNNWSYQEAFSRHRYEYIKMLIMYKL